MHRIECFVDQRQKSWCIHCGDWIARCAVSEDHVPSRALLERPFPSNPPTVEICHSCNNSFAHDEEYFAAFLRCVLAGSTRPEEQINKNAGRVLAHSPKLAARIERSRRKYTTGAGTSVVVWKPEFERIDRIIVKNARGHAYFEIGEPLLHEPCHVRVVPLEGMSRQEHDDFERMPETGLLPEVGSRMLLRVFEGQDLCDGWVVVQKGVYRYAAVQADVMLVRMVMYEYLAAEVSWAEDDGHSNPEMEAKAGLWQGDLFAGRSDRRCRPSRDDVEKVD